MIDEKYTTDDLFIISLNLHVYVNFYVDHEDLLLLHVKVSILDLRLHH